MSLRVWAPEGMPEVRPGDDLAAMILDVVGPLEDGDLLVVTSKVVSKAENRIVPADRREEALAAETVRVVASRETPSGVTRIVENRQGLVLAAAGIDASNAPDGSLLLLPVDPDASARALCETIRASRGVRIGVIVSDTLGRPWRVGQTDVAIGAAGVRVLDDLRGSTDANGMPLTVTMPAVGDEIAAMADLVKGKSSARPVAVVRGLGHLVTGIDEPGARRLQRSPDEDLFRSGTQEAWSEGFDAGRRAAAAEDGR